MKKVFALLAITSVMVACNNSGDSAAPAADTTATAPAADTTAAPAADTTAAAPAADTTAAK